MSAWFLFLFLINFASFTFGELAVGAAGAEDRPSNVLVREGQGALNSKQPAQGGAKSHVGRKQKKFERFELRSPKFCLFTCDLEKEYDALHRQFHQYDSTPMVGDLLCDRLLTDVTEGVEKGSVLVAKGFTFQKNYYERINGTHYRICICTKVPCLRKCCPLGQVYIEQKCSPYDLDIAPPVYTPDLKLIPDYGIQNFHRIYGTNRDNNMFELEPEISKEEEYYLLTNGTLVFPYENTALEASEFCFENALWEIPRNRQSLRVFAHFEDYPPPETLVIPIGMIISMPFLLATFIVYSLPELRNLHGKNLMSHVASLLTAYIALVFVQLAGKDLSATVCTVCGFLIPYAFLATFLWLNVMCFDIWSAFSGFGKISGHSKEKENKRFLVYSLYAWGCPLVILIIMVVVDYAPNVPDFIVKPNIGTMRCYFETRLATLLYFYLPMALVVACDITLFVLTAVKICKVRRETKVLTGNESRRNDDAKKQRYNLYLKLFLVMGINWVTEIVSWVFGGMEFWYVTDVMNSLQGLFIFWIFVCSRKIKKILILRFCPKYAPRDTETQTSSFKTSASANSDVVLKNLSGRKVARAT